MSFRMIAVMATFAGFPASAMVLYFAEGEFNFYTRTLSSFLRNDCRYMLVAEVFSHFAFRIDFGAPTVRKFELSNILVVPRKRSRITLDFF